MPDRRKQTIQLLATRYDGLYLPAGALRTPSGLAPGKRVPCPDCGHTDHPGWQVDAFKRSTPCQKCGGTPKRRGKGFVYVDAMDSLQVPIGDSETAATARPRRTVTCDRCNGEGVWKGERCELCDGEGRRDLHVFELHVVTERDSSGDPMTDAIEARNASGSYRDLELAVAGIRVHVNKPARYHWLTINASWALRLLDELTLDSLKARELQAHTYPHAMSQTAVNLVELALDYIQSRLPDPIRVPASVRLNERELANQRLRVNGRKTDERALDSRNGEIKTAIRRGVPTQRVAFEYGLSVSQVNRIVGGEAA